MPRLTRRRLFAAGGAGAAASVLAACGATEAESERSADGDAQLLSDASAQEQALGVMATEAERRLGGREAELAGAIAGASTGRARQLEALLREAQTEIPGIGVFGGGSIDGIEAASSSAIAAYREGAALLSTPELRKVALEHILQVAAELAAVRDLLDEEPSPFAFVTGGPEEPYEDTDFDPTADE